MFIATSVLSLKSDEKMHPNCEAGGSVKPGVKRSGSPGLQPRNSQPAELAAECRMVLAHNTVWVSAVAR